MQSIIVHPSAHAEDDRPAARFALDFQSTVTQITDAIRRHPNPRWFHTATAYNMTFPWSRVEHPRTSPYREVIAEYVATLPLLEQEQADTIISLDANREMNMVPGTRPSSAARSAVRAHRLGDLTPESFRKAREHDYHR
jgi:hypothetical protein